MHLFVCVCVLCLFVCHDDDDVENDLNISEETFRKIKRRLNANKRESGIVVKL